MDLSIGANTVNYMRRHLCLRSLFILALLTANTAIAWECTYGPSVEKTSIETLYEKATNVVFVQVTKGELIRDEIRYSAKVIKSLKGKTKSKIKLIDNALTAPRQITIGESYIIYLFGYTGIDFCTPLFLVWTPNNTIEELIKFSERADMEYSKEIRKTLILSNIIDEI